MEHPLSQAWLEQEGVLLGSPKELPKSRIKNSKGSLKPRRLRNGISHERHYHRPEALELLQRRWHVVWRLRRAAHLSAVPEDGRKGRDIVVRGVFLTTLNMQLTSSSMLNHAHAIRPCRLAVAYIVLF